MANKIDWLENLQKAKRERPQDLEKYETSKYKQNLSVEEKTFVYIYEMVFIKTKEIIKLIYHN